MGEENWTQRQPGSAAGSVVPPAAAEISEPEQAPPLAAGLAPGRFWFRRRLSRHPGSRWRRLAWAAALAFVLVVAAGTAVSLSIRHAGSSAAGPGAARTPGTTGPAMSGLSSAATARVRAAAWISREVSRGAIIACDAVTCSSLLNDGLPASNLLVISPATPDPLGADVVVVTPVVRSQFGGRLRSVYAPTVLASFGSGESRVDVRVVAPDGGASYEKALREDVAARKTAGVQLLRNKRIALPAHAVVQLAAGWVDPRLLLLLPVLAAQHPVRILAFGDPAPGAGWGVPLTSVELSGSGRVTGLPGRGYVRWLLGFLRGQRPPYLAASITARRHGGQLVVVARFARPSPVGLLAHG